MIDRNKRDAYAETLRHFVAGNTLNMDYEDSMDELLKCGDLVIHQIYCEIWPLYCDIRKHRMRGGHRLDKDQRREISRFIMFLYSNREYEWPLPSLWRRIASLLTLGFFNVFFSEPACEGEGKVWPYFRAEDYRIDLLQPRLLRGIC